MYIDYYSKNSFNGKNLLAIDLHRVEYSSDEYFRKKFEKELLDKTVIVFDTYDYSILIMGQQGQNMQKNNADKNVMLNFEPITNINSMGQSKVDGEYIILGTLNPNLMDNMVPYFEMLEEKLEQNQKRTSKIGAMPVKSYV